MTRPEDKNRTRIAIDLPLPLDVAGTLTKLIGTVYPSAMIDGSGGSSIWPGRQLVITVDDRDRKRLPGKKRAAALMDHQPDEVTAEADLTGVSSDGDGFSFHMAPTEDLCLYLGAICRPILDRAGEEAVNYVEWEVVDRADTEQRMVLAVARSKGQTPGALRTKAEARVAELEAEVAALRAQIDG